MLLKVSNEVNVNVFHVVEETKVAISSDSQQVGYGETTTYWAKRLRSKCLLGLKYLGFSRWIN